MILSPTVLLLSLPLALAQYGGGSPAASPTTSSTSAPASTTAPSVSIQTVTVGENNQLVFNPDTITAAVGSEVEFIFFPPSHSVVQAAFDAPCQPIGNNGFYSGAFTTSSGSNANSFTITINDTNPIWIFCGFPGHCEAGLVGVINPNASQTLSLFKAAAAKVSSTTDPTFAPQGGVIGPVQAAVSASPSSSVSATPKPGSASEIKGSTLWAGLLATVVTAWGIAELMA
ncbi:hypothetical protein OIDMADRAFT_43580 [Oidiodendron maius Zn]|uniref:Phytocyanin domain-containing protein n=1 Tax=Oidiodendron maius (strain Zn) TaxID=913774 RepID=A0A0C3CFC5_OIDMZ|nr:hypothetical protein OIDMADRAFT_43580 [Oidiodendron maius Zn]